MQFFIQLCSKLISLLPAVEMNKEQDNHVTHHAQSTNVLLTYNYTQLWLSDKITKSLIIYNICIAPKAHFTGDYGLCMQFASIYYHHWINNQMQGKPNVSLPGCATSHWRDEEQLWIKPSKIGCYGNVLWGTKKLISDWSSTAIVLSTLKIWRRSVLQIFR